MAVRAPIVFFAFNRPSLLPRTLRPILAADPESLIVICDGPRSEISSDRDQCDQVREVLESMLSGRRVEWLRSTANLGAGRRIASGLDWVFSKYPEAIILEDDLLVDDSFFPFCDELLEKFRDEERIAMISGCNFQGGRRFGAHSYYFSACAGTLGWATWSRVWRLYDYSMSTWSSTRASGRLATIWPVPEASKYWTDRFDEVVPGRSDVWDYQWAHLMWSRGLLEVYPNRNLVSHIGCTAEATHVVSPEDPACNVPLAPMEYPLTHPPRIQRDLAADLREFRLLFQRLAADD